MLLDIHDGNSERPKDAPSPRRGLALQSMDELKLKGSPDKQIEAPGSMWVDVSGP